MTFHLPAVNACFNALSVLFLTGGYVFIRNNKVAAHRACMGGALASSTLFLAGYLYYHAHAGVTRFQGTGWVRAAYFLILSTHTVLAAAILPMVIVTLALALKSNFESHRRWARVTFPAWMYVSVTGVVIYWMLYR